MVRSKPKKTAENVSKLTICALTVIILAFAFIIAFAFNDGSDCESVKYWSLSEIDPLSLVNLKIVLNVLGWKEVDNMEDADWLWFHDYPFTQFSAEMKKLKAHQRVNHFPGSGWITSKALMSRSVISNHIPKAFYPIHDAEIMKQYFRAHPEKKFVQKGLSNRRVKVITTSDIDMNANLFIQEFIENPLLLDGYHFDFGIFVVVTSIDPLRLYIYDGQMVMRFCTEKYHPFDVENVEKYVIQDPFQYGDTLSIIGKHVNVTKFTMRGAFAAALTNEGHDPEKIFKQVEDIIVDVYTQQEKRLIETLKNFSSKNNFFELVRFDFIIDDNLKVHLMEVNMSPSTKFLDRQKILYNVLNLVGRTKRIEEQLIGADDIMVNPFLCGFPPCSESCELEKCSLCFPCLQKDDVTELKNAFREHRQKGNFKRLIPSSMHYKKDVMEKLSPKNKMMTKWFERKCRYRGDWC